MPEEITQETSTDNFIRTDKTTVNIGAEHTNPIEPEDTFGSWYSQDITEARKQIAQYKALLAKAEDLDDYELRQTVESAIADTQFYLAVQERAATVDRVKLEQLHTLYGEGTAWHVHGEIGGRNIRKRWMDTIREYHDTLGIMQAVRDVAGGLEFIAPETRGFSTIKSDTLDKVAEAIETQLVNLPHPVTIAYGERGKPLTVRNGNKQKTFSLNGYGFHAHITQSPIEDELLRVYDYDENRDWAAIGLSNDLLAGPGDDEIFVLKELQRLPMKVDMKMKCISLQHLSVHMDRN